MSPFTQFLGRLVALVGTENAADLVREFAGKTLEFPATGHFGVTRNDFGFPNEAPVIDARLAELRAACTRRNGKVLLSDRQLEEILQSQASGKAPCAPQADLASPQTPSVDQPLADQTQPQPCSILQPNVSQSQGCSEQLHSPRHVAPHTTRSPSRLGGLFRRVAAWFQCASGR
ncbi:MAG: hypothetical protein ACI4NJ_00825 [Cellvibrio sp.]